MLGITMELSGQSLPMSLLPAKYSLSNLQTALSNPQMFLGELNHVGNQINEAIHRRRYADTGADLMTEEWDNCIILDACRYDIYREHTTIDGELQMRIAAGSESWEFMRSNFVGRTFHDTVYVTANPHAYKLPEDTFHYTRNLLDDEWDPDLKTVTPDTVVEATLEAAERFPDKRLLVHFMQPHFPFIGERGRQLDSGGIVAHRDDGEGDMLIWGKLRYGLLPVDSIWEAYVENLDVVLPHVQDLLDALDGLSVVTADHGNLFGERLRPIPTRAYGHPSGIYAKALREVPWHVIPGERRTITADAPVGHEDLDDSVAAERLRDLGYVA